MHDRDINGPLVRNDQMRGAAGSSATYIVMPDGMAAEDARRTKLWLNRVVMPAIDFAGGLGDTDETD